MHAADVTLILLDSIRSKVFFSLKFFRSIFFFRLVITFTLSTYTAHTRAHTKITAQQLLLSLVFVLQFTYKSTWTQLWLSIFGALRKHQKPFNQFVCLWLGKISNCECSCFSSRILLLFRFFPALAQSFRSLVRFRQLMANNCNIRGCTLWIKPRKKSASLSIPL